MKKFLIRAIIFAGIASFGSCGNKGNVEVAKTAEAPLEDNHKNPGEATLTTEQMKTIGVELGSIEQKQLTASLKTNGVLKVPNQNKASINSVYSGVIKS